MTGWYTNRNGIVRGPFSAVQIERHVLLGRIGIKDLLSPDREEWSSIYHFPEILPDELSACHESIDYDVLVEARLRYDERIQQRRCKACDKCSGGQDRRMHPDRRQQGSEVEVLLSMASHAENINAIKNDGCTWRVYLLSILLALLFYMMAGSNGIY